MRVSRLSSFDFALSLVRFICEKSTIYANIKYDAPSKYIKEFL
jgi:hypothetical protein